MEILLSEKLDKIITPFASYLVLSWEDPKYPENVLNGTYVTPVDYLSDMQPHISNFLLEHPNLIIEESRKPTQFDLPNASIGHILSKEYLQQVSSTHGIPSTLNSLNLIKNGLERAIWYQLIEKESKNRFNLDSSAPPSMAEFSSDENSLAVIDCNIGHAQNYGTGDLSIYKVQKTNQSILGKFFEIETLDIMKIHKTKITRLSIPDFMAEPKKTNRFKKEIKMGKCINIDGEFYQIQMSEKIRQDMVNYKSNK